MDALTERSLYQRILLLSVVSDRPPSSAASNLSYSTNYLCMVGVQQDCYASSNQY
ncbi:hypothetical protein [Microcoleus sp. K5-D4]|uniref:hypothetical protein n=1 Tax=Microcoleus sp. K5-D4 TaxID=2818801 RepID=UPI002FD1394A